jgi:hypothetical protein
MNLCARIITELKVPAAAAAATPVGAAAGVAAGGPLSPGAPMGALRPHALDAAAAGGLLRPTALLPDALSSALPPPAPIGVGGASAGGASTVLLRALPPVVPGGPPQLFYVRPGTMPEVLEPLPQHLYAQALEQLHQQQLSVQAAAAHH